MTLPAVLGGKRRKLFVWLLLNGAVQAALGLAAVVTFERFHASGFTDGLAVAILIGLAAGLYVSRVLQRRHGEMFALDYVNETRLALLQKVLSLSDIARGASIGLVTARLSNDLLALKNWLAEGMANSIVQGMTLAVLLVGAAVLYPQVAIVLACVVVPWLLGVALLRRPLKEAIGAARKQRGRLAVLAGDQVVARLTLAHFGRTTPALKDVARRADALANALIRRATLSEAMRAATEWALPLASLAALWLFGAGSQEVPAAAPLLLLLAMTGTLLAGLSRAVDLYLAHRLAVARFAAVFEASGVEASANAPSPSFKRGKPVELALHWTSTADLVTRHAVPLGAVMSLAGGTAGQRSGVLAAIARLRDDPRLTPALAGLPASRIPIRDWRRAVTLCSPRLPLIRGTLGENLAIGAPSATSEEEVLVLARHFGIAAALADLQESIEPGHLSVPQALAMRLCRSLIRNAPIILLDETTSASEFPLMARFLDLAKERRVSVLTSGGVLDRRGAPVGESLLLYFEAAPGIVPAAETPASREPASREPVSRENGEMSDAAE